MTQQYDETAGNVPTAIGYKEAIESGRAMAESDRISGRSIYDLAEALSILKLAFTEFPGYLTAQYPTLFA